MTTSAQSILITGVNSYWGRRVAQRLLLEPSLTVIGIDGQPLSPPITGLDFHQVDMRENAFPDLLQTAKVEIVCHLGYQDGAAHSMANEDYNVMRTIRLFGLCAQMGVHKIVTGSSTMVYGAQADNPAFLTEEHPLRGNRENAGIRYHIDHERFYANFRQNNPAITQTTLRFANIVGPTCDTPMTRFLREPKAPILLGFDPMLQFIHEDDVVEALAFAVINEVGGVFNIAGISPLPLIRVLALAKKFPIAIPHPLAYLGREFLNGQAADIAPLDFDYLRYRWVADTQKMQEEMGFMPAFSGDEAVRALNAGKNPGQWESLFQQAANQGEQLRSMIDKYRQHSDASDS